MHNAPSHIVPGGTNSFWMTGTRVLVLGIMGGNEDSSMKRILLINDGTREHEGEKRLEECVDLFTSLGLGRNLEHWDYEDVLGTRLDLILFDFAIVQVSTAVKGWQNVVRHLQQVEKGGKIACAYQGVLPALQERAQELGITCIFTAHNKMEESRKLVREYVND